MPSATPKRGSNQVKISFYLLRMKFQNYLLLKPSNPMLRISLIRICGVKYLNRGLAIALVPAKPFKFKEM